MNGLRASLVALGLVLTACAGGDAGASDDGASDAEPVSEAAPEDSDPGTEIDEEAGFLIDLSEEQIALVDECGGGDRDACSAALQFLSPDHRTEIAEFCDVGDTLACDTVFWLDDTERGADCGDFCDEEPPAHSDCEDDCTEDDVASDGGDLDAFIELNAAGIDTDTGLLEFGADAGATVDALVGYWGEPSNDTGWIPSAGNCNVGDQFRTIEWEWTYVVFLEGAPAFDGRAHLASWVTSDPDQSTIAFVGDTTTVPIRSGHTTVAELRQGLGEAVTIDDEGRLGPAFYIEDNFGSMQGELENTSDDAIVQSVSAGDGCAE